MGCTSSKAAEPQVTEPVVPSFEGEEIAGYQVIEELGEGLYGRVVRVCVPGVEDKQYTLKMIERRYLVDEADALEEVEILKAVDHPHVVKFTDFQEHPDRFIVVTEALNGGELLERIAHLRHYTEDDAREAVVTIIETLAYLHSRGVVHRDIKPEALVLAQQYDDRSLTITEFGSSRRLGGGQATQLKGTPNYVAPEMLRRQPYGTAVDMWSIGCVVFIMLGGYMPFYDRSARDLVRKVLSAEYEFHPDYFGHVSDEAKDFVSKLLVIDPEERLTAEQALQHPWLIQEKSVLTRRGLDKSIAVIKLFNARRKFRAAVHAAVATGRLVDVIKSAQHEIEVEEEAAKEQEKKVEEDVQDQKETPAIEEPSAAEQDQAVEEAEAMAADGKQAAYTTTSDDTPTPEPGAQVDGGEEGHDREEDRREAEDEDEVEEEDERE